jgi:hypothetical protein
MRFYLEIYLQHYLATHFTPKYLSQTIPNIISLSPIYFPLPLLSLSLSLPTLFFFRRLSLSLPSPPVVYSHLLSVSPTCSRGSVFFPGFPEPASETLLPPRFPPRIIIPPLTRLVSSLARLIFADLSPSTCHLALPLVPLVGHLTMTVVHPLIPLGFAQIDTSALFPLCLLIPLMR